MNILNILPISIMPNCIHNKTSSIIKIKVKPTIINTLFLLVETMLSPLSLVIFVVLTIPNNFKTLIKFLSIQ